MRDDNNSAEKSKKKYCFVERILLLLPPTIFLIFTFAIYMPSSLFISNIDDFALDYIKIVPLIALVSVAVLVIAETARTAYIGFVRSEAAHSVSKI